MRNTKLIIGTMAASLAGLGIVIVAATRPPAGDTPQSTPEHTSVRDQANPEHAPPAPAITPAPKPTPPKPIVPIAPVSQPLPAPVR